MGQKVNPVGLRVGVNRTWDSRWFAGRGEYGRLLHEDMIGHKFGEFAPTSMFHGHGGDKKATKGR